MEPHVDKTIEDAIDKSVKEHMNVLYETWNSADLSYAPEVTYSTLLNLVFQFAAFFGRVTEGATSSEMVLDQFVNDIKTIRPGYLKKEEK